MESQASNLRADIAHSARVYDYLLGGKDNFATDREAAERIIAKMPHLPTSMRAARDFNARLVRHLATEHGIRQILDIGTGLPTSPNLHEIAQQINRAARIVYVDNDPLVLAHARATPSIAERASRSETGPTAKCWPCSTASTSSTPV